MDYPSIEDFVEDVDLNVVENLQSNSDEIEEEETVDPSIRLDANTEDHVEVNFESLPVILVGKEFASYEEAWLSYVNYARIKGFQPRKHTTYKSTKTQLTIGRTYVCSKEGAKDISREVATKRRRDTREKCPARMRITLDQNREVWRVTQFIDDHCHELGLLRTSSGQQLRNRFHLNPLAKTVVERLHANGVNNQTIAKVLNSGALNDDILVTNRHCLDHTRKIGESNIGSECVSVIQLFQERVKIDPLFFFAIELDTDRTLRSVFWADGRSRSAYLEFNDIVSFDVTYRTNKFSMPFAPFTGINHHWQSTLFGCALLADETEDSFVWLFRQWLSCMFDIAPRTIITAEDGQICNAIKQVFPNTHHRYCSWHVNKHAIEHLGLLKPSNKDFAEDFHVWFHSETIAESESRWEMLKAKYSLGDQNWLVMMYEKRKHWVPAYLREVFTCGMKSTQPSEIINAFFDGYVDSMTPLGVFVEQYDKAIASRRKAEKDEDFVTLNSKSRCESGLPWELQAASFYTRKLFQVFHQEFVTSQSYIKEKISKDGGKAVYRVGKPDIDKKHWRIVVHDVSDGGCFTCSCAKFETEGMLCRHIMAILRLKQILVIPEKYFLKRWSINGLFKAIPDDSSSMCTKEALGNEDITPKWLFSLQYKHLKVLEEASSSVSVLKDYESYLDKFLAEITRKKLGICGQQVSQNPSVSEPIVSNSHLTICDKKQPVRTKGRPTSASRIKSNGELSQQKKEGRQNRCKCCGKLGHNRAGCELRKS